MRCSQTFERPGWRAASSPIRVHYRDEGDTERGGDPHPVSYAAAPEQNAACCQEDGGAQAEDDEAGKNCAHCACDRRFTRFITFAAWAATQCRRAYLALPSSSLDDARQR